jgi:predicted PurR-regulated permease PerM
MGSESERASPPWNPTTKLVVTLTFLVLIGALLVRFRNIIGPLLLAFILAYVLHPVVSFLSSSTRLSWRAAASVVFLVAVVLVLGSLSLTGFTVAQQIQSLVVVVRQFLTRLPDIVEDIPPDFLSTLPIPVDLSLFIDLSALSEQILSALQPVLGRVTNLVGTFATSAAISLGWLLFILLVAYFVLVDAAQGVPEALLSVDVPGYQDDLTRMGRELNRIWNAFLRGQVLLFGLTVVAYAVLMTALGLRFALGLALLAGFSRFVPYIGPLSVWIITALVAIFQERNFIGLTPLQYMLLVVGVAVLLDQVFDNLVTPRFLGDTLGVHPAAVLVGAIIATNLIGIIGLLLAAPVLATLQLFGRYAVRKIFDLEPWPESESPPPRLGFIGALARWQAGARAWLQNRKIFRRGGSDDVERSP